ncbi:hypothetical protein C8J57DRAFT_1563154 [Mycena rebaudengoi]|nr:hypothetical protein C8J57DRAFT_1563154 [Mycena rebaudengoi]
MVAPWALPEHTVDTSRHLSGPCTSGRAAAIKACFPPPPLHGGQSTVTCGLSCSRHLTATRAVTFLNPDALSSITDFGLFQYKNVITSNPTGQQSRAQTADADDEGEGDSVGSQDSDEDVELSDAGSIASFISNDDSGSDDDEDGMADHAAGDEDNQQDGDWDGTAQFAAAYDIDMNENDDEQQIFGDGSSDSD